MKQEKSEYLLWGIFFTIGLIFVIIGSIICLNIFNYKNKIDTNGTITHITSDRDYDNENIDHDVYVKYTVNDREYESRLNSYSSSFYEGKQIKIYYDKNNPNLIGVKSLDLLFLIFPGIGLIFFIIGATGLIIKIKKNISGNKLKETGNRIDAKYIETTLNTTYSINGKSPYNIICEWINPTDSKTYTFKSKNLWYDPEDIIYRKKITTFPVYVDMNNIKKYIVDTDILNDN